MAEKVLLYFIGCLVATWYVLLLATAMTHTPSKRCLRYDPNNQTLELLPASQCATIKEEKMKCQKD